jgi:hypothetical protein
MRRIVILAAAAATLSGGAWASEEGVRGIKDGELRLDVITPGAFEQMPEAAPPRFVLLEDGRFFVGGSSAIASGQLDGNEHKSLRKMVESILKRKDLAANIELGPGETQYRLAFRKGEPITATGDPRNAPYGAARDVARLVLTLLEFDHVTLTPIEPEQLLLIVHQGEDLRGGCRPWTLPVTPLDALPAPRLVNASDVVGWPRGSTPASVCAQGKLYVVGLRPLLPVERR